MERPAASQAIRAASVWIAGLVGTKTLKILVMVNTRRSSLLKTAIASSASCWREPFFLILRRERASKRASREGGPEVHELVSEQAYERFASKQALMCPQSSAASGGTSRMSASKPRTDEL